MGRGLGSLLLVWCLATPAFAGQLYNAFTSRMDLCSTIQESDGSPSNAVCGQLNVPNGSLTDNGDGTYTLSFAALFAPLGSAFVTIGADATLTAERALTGTANQLTVTDNGANSTVVLSTPQNIHTGATPTFASLTLSGLTANSFLYSGTGGLLTTTAAPTNGQLLLGSTGVAPVVGTIAGVAAETDVTVGAGTLTLGLVDPLAFGKGGTGLAAAADDTTLVSSGTAWAATAIPNCTDSGGNHLNYTIATNSFSCGTSSSSPTHNLLSATHADTTAAAVVRGDLITGQGAVPTWSRLAIGGANTYPKSDGTDVVWAAPTGGGTVLGTGRTLTGGVGIAALGDLSADRTVAFDATEISSLTWGAGAFTTMTFDAGTCDPRITAGNKLLTFSCVSGTNNEDLTFDFDTTANTVAASSSTGVTKLNWGTVGAAWSDGALVDLSAETCNTTTECLKLGAYNAGGTAEGEMAWDPTNDRLYIGDSAAAIEIGASVWGGSTGATGFVAKNWCAAIGSACSTTEADTDSFECPLNTTVVADNLHAELNTAVGLGGSWVVSLRLNGANSALTCTMSAGTTECDDTTNKVVIAAGDTVQIEWNPAGILASNGGQAWALTVHPN